MKGILLGGVDAELVDITHAIPPQDVTRAAHLIDEVVDAFPPSTIHLVVVDPGVGTQRSIVAVETPIGRFVGPDNGLFGPVTERSPASLVVECNDPRWWRDGVSPTFHGRDVMAPLAAHWAGGIDPRRFGTPRDTGELSSLPHARPDRDDEGLRGCVLWADHFGNLVTNIRRTDLVDSLAELVVRLGDVDIGPLRRTYAEVDADAALALLGSSDRLEIAVNGGSAAEQFGWRTGDDRPVVVRRSER